MLLITKNERLTRSQALATNVEIIFERVVTELVQKMKEMKVIFGNNSIFRAQVNYFDNSNFFVFTKF